MKLLAALSLFVVASTALPVDTPAVGVGVPNATAVEVAEKRQANPFEEIYLLDCWNYGVRQSWVFVRHLFSLINAVVESSKGEKG